MNRLCWYEKYDQQGLFIAKALKKYRLWGNI